MSRTDAERFGHWGETRAAWYLRLKGWRILDRRVKTRRGEVDIIARRGRTIIFVEVKARKDEAALSLSIDEHRLRRVQAAATQLYPRYAMRGEDARIDVVLICPGRWPQHVENALPY